MRENVRRYLAANFEATPEQVDQAMGSPEAKAIIDDAAKFGSAPYYAGDKIAELFAFTELPEPEDEFDRYDGSSDWDERKADAGA